MGTWKCRAVVVCRVVIFFFSSRRRHTRLQGDWSSDVCSSDLPGLAAEADFAGDGSYPFGAHCAVVEVDVETGDARLVRFFAVDDCGRIINPLLAEGQVHGGIAQGIGQALLEEVVFDDQGTPRTGTVVDYQIPSIGEVPEVVTATTETLSPNNPLGAKGIGESGTIGSTPAIQDRKSTRLELQSPCNLVCRLLL